MFASSTTLNSPCLTSLVASYQQNDPYITLKLSSWWWI